MEISSGDEINIDAQMETSIGRVQILRRIWTKPVDCLMKAENHRLELCLLPRAGRSEAGFPERWDPNRLEPIGDLCMIPDKQLMHIKSAWCYQTSIAIIFDRAAAATWFEGDWEWTDRRLQAGLDITSPEIRALVFRIGQEIRSPGLASKTLTALMAVRVAMELSRYFLAIEDEPVAGGLAAWRLKLIDRRLASDMKPLSILELAGMCNIPARQLTREFRISRGRPIMSYVTEHRINHARRMLASGMSVKAVASAMTFATARNFILAFRRATGETPRDYRQRFGHDGAMISLDVD